MPQSSTIVLFHVAAFAVCLLGSLAKTLLLLPGEVSPFTAGRIDKLNRITAIAAGVSILTGGILLFGVGQDPLRYLGQPIFVAKLALFAVVSGLVLRAKPFFRLAAAASGPTQVSRRLRLFLLADLCSLPVIAAIGRWVATH